MNKDQIEMCTSQHHFGVNWALSWCRNKDIRLMRAYLCMNRSYGDKLFDDHDDIRSALPTSSTGNIFMFKKSDLERRVYRMKR